jgi:hypothetical protein
MAESYSSRHRHTHGFSVTREIRRIYAPSQRERVKKTPIFKLAPKSTDVPRGSRLLTPHILTVSHGRVWGERGGSKSIQSP